MDYSLQSAGRTAHLKMVVVALACAAVIVLVGLNAKTDIATADLQTKSVVVKAGQPMRYADQETSTIR